MKTIQIVVHVFAHEMHDFQRVIEQLKRNLEFTQAKSFSFDITLNVSETKYDWQNSILQPSFFVQQFEDLCKMLPNVTTDIIFDGDYGCNSVRRKAARAGKFDYIGYLDLDLHFSMYTLHYIDNAIQSLSQQEKQIVVSGQIPRLWDSTWDIISNQEFIEMGTESKIWLTIDPYSIDKLVYDRLSKIQLKQLPYVKIGGGWMNFIDQKVLQLVDIPDSLGAYGMDDTYVQEAFNVLNKNNITNVKQYVVDNLLVCENRKYESYEPYLDNGYLKLEKELNDYKEQMAHYARQNCWMELEKLLNKLNGKS